MTHSLLLQNTTTPWTNFLQGSTPFNLNLEITDLPTGQLAEATLTHFDANGLPMVGTLTIDDDANGLGWFIDETPWENSEFRLPQTETLLRATPGSAAYGRYGLLITILHELGHLAGIIHGNPAYDDRIQYINGSPTFIGNGYSAQHVGWVSRSRTQQSQGRPLALSTQFNEEHEYIGLSHLAQGKPELLRNQKNSTQISPGWVTNLPISQHSIFDSSSADLSFLEDRIYHVDLGDIGLVEASKGQISIREDDSKQIATREVDFSEDRVTQINISEGSKTARTIAEISSTQINFTEPDFIEIQITQIASREIDIVEVTDAKAGISKVRPYQALTFEFGDFETITSDFKIFEASFPASIQLDNFSPGYTSSTVHRFPPMINLFTNRVDVDHNLLIYCLGLSRWVQLM